jgi:branched-subunit amino acid transport protein
MTSWVLRKNHNIPVSLGWVLLVAAWRTVINQGWGRNPVFLVVVGVILVALIVWAFVVAVAAPANGACT